MHLEGGLRLGFWRGEGPGLQKRTLGGGFGGQILEGVWGDDPVGRIEGERLGKQRTLVVAEDPLWGQFPWGGRTLVGWENLGEGEPS